MAFWASYRLANTSGRPHLSLPEPNMWSHRLEDTKRQSYVLCLAALPDSCSRVFGTTKVWFPIFLQYLNGGGGGKSLVVKAFPHHKSRHMLFTGIQQGLKSFKIVESDKHIGGKRTCKIQPDHFFGPWGCRRHSWRDPCQRLCETFRTCPARRRSRATGAGQNGKRENHFLNHGFVWLRAPPWEPRIRESLVGSSQGGRSLLRSSQGGSGVLGTSQGGTGCL